MQEIGRLKEELATNPKRKTAVLKARLKDDLLEAEETLAVRSAELRCCRTDTKNTSSEHYIPGEQPKKTTTRERLLPKRLKRKWSST